MPYLVLLLTTLLVEGAVVFLFGLRTIRDHVRVVLVNCITHPIFFGSILLLGGTMQWQGMPDISAIIIALEVLVVLAEFFLLSWLYPKRRRVFLFCMDLIMNTASTLVGFIVFF
ncbi:MAG: hypothetical protein Q8P56_05465 [Candidatus Uhrbacteria bacterium]|nr:hypothetical protein [Candidatus Uhrbacteria bacterium]